MSAAVMRLPLPRGRAGADQLPPFLRNLPKHCAPGKTYVYAVFFSGGIVKIGQTKSPRSRLREHIRSSQGTPTRVHLFAPVDGAAANSFEREARTALKDVACSINKSEWFRLTGEQQDALSALRRLRDKCSAYVVESKEAEAARQRRLAVANAALAAVGLEISGGAWCLTVSQKAAA